MVSTGSSAFAVAFPHSTVYATDIASVQPDMVPPNLQVILDDVNSTTWLWHPGSVDYVHFRDSSTAIRDWLATLREAHRCLAPGGFLEAAVFLPGVRAAQGVGLPSEWQYWALMLALQEPATVLSADLARSAGLDVVSQHSCRLPLAAGTHLLEHVLDRIDAAHNYIGHYASAAHAQRERAELLDRLRATSQNASLV